MRIMVFDVPAESGGALSVLHEFYNECKHNQKNEYIFIVSLPELKETSNIKVLKFPWIKKSWGHRLYFDHIIAHKLIKKHNIDRVLSLQNVIIPHTNVYQSVLIHNALPFSEYRFNFKENKILWIYQNFIGKIIINSILNADKVIVQTKWLKKILIEKLKISNEKIIIRPPQINIHIKKKFKENKKRKTMFFYPASGMEFKNHKAIIEACIKLKEQGIEEYKVFFTLKGNENKYIENLFNIALKNKLPIEFIGNIKQYEVFEYYSKSILVFPSLIETYGLPLLEAKRHHTPIIVYDKPFSKEILSNYKYVEFVNQSLKSNFEISMKKYI